MSAKGTFKFGNYTLRPAGANPADAILALQWTKADPYHAGKVDPGFWLEQDYDRDSYLLLDELGALFFWKGIILTHRMIPHPELAGAVMPGTKVSNVTQFEPYRQLEMHVQFPPVPLGSTYQISLQRTRLTTGLIEGLKWLEPVLQQAKVREIYFDSDLAVLTVFCTRHLGFTCDGKRLRKQLSSPPENAEAYGNESTSSAGGL